MKNDGWQRRICWIDQIEQSQLNTAIEAEEMNMFVLLKPKIFQDGNAWCVLYGEDIQTGICGVGDTPRKAIHAFNKAWDENVQGKEE